MIQIIIADDHAIFRQGLCALLAARPDIRVIGQAKDGRETADMIIRLRPNMAIVDISMPELNGIEVLKNVQTRNSGTKIILLTMHTEPELAKQALAAGVCGYLLKKNAFEDLVSAIYLIHNGGTFVSPAISSEHSSHDDILSPREREVLQGISKGLSNKEMANHLNISVRTVETHRANMMEKLNLHTTAELVRYAIKKGIYIS